MHVVRDRAARLRAELADWAARALCAELSTLRHPDGTPVRVRLGDRWVEARDGRWIDRLFFPEPGSGGYAHRSLAEARRICERCPVRLPCLEAAIANGERWGVWGGLTPEERRSIA